MKFEWDEDKNEANIRKHGLDFTEGRELLLNSGIQPFLIRADLRDEYRREMARTWDNPGKSCCGCLYGEAAELNQVHLVKKGHPEGAAHL